MNQDPTFLNGLSEAEAARRLAETGPNVLTWKRSGDFWTLVWSLVSEPMFLLLVGAALLYFALGEQTEGFWMLGAMLLVSAVNLLQEWRSQRALEALHQLSSPRSRVIREGSEHLIDSEQLVVGDLMVLEEGTLIAADARVLRSHDLFVDESSLTGESLAVSKHEQGDALLYQGCLVSGGSCVAEVQATGARTRLNRLGASLKGRIIARTPLQRQLGRLVKGMAAVGIAIMILVALLFYSRQHAWLDSLLVGLTLAMSAIPEEIPMAYASFLALGAYRMSRRDMLLRQPQTAEHLGAASVVCLDKTGTLTENKMQVMALYHHASHLLVHRKFDQSPACQELLLLAALASEPRPYDPMEQAIWRSATELPGPRPLLQLDLIHEYPLEGHPPMMTHIYERSPGHGLAAAKGAPERILQVCQLPEADVREALRVASKLAALGMRVLGLARCDLDSLDVPEHQDGFSWRFLGLIALVDPPRPEASGLLKSLYEAGMEVKLMTGDYLETAQHISDRVGLRRHGALSGSEVMALDDETLSRRVADCTLMARMSPEAKLRVIQSLKREGRVVVMTGDGVNDAPAMKAADVGISMGKKGADLSRSVAGLIITNDRLDRITEAIELGRRIFENIKKAVAYTLSIHLPIMAVVLVPLLAGWKTVNLLGPVHVIFLELIMGPTCSIFFENEPVEQDLMRQAPRRFSSLLFSRREIGLIVIQGMLGALAVLGLYAWGMHQGLNAASIRSLVFLALLWGNIFLTQECRSFRWGAWQNLRMRNPLMVPVLLASLGFVALLSLVPGIRNLFGLVSLNASLWFLSLAAGAQTLIWMDGLKALFRRFDLSKLSRRSEQS